MSYEVWTKNAIDQDRWVVIDGLSHAKATTLMQSLTNIYPGVPVWMEES